MTDFFEHLNKIPTTLAPIEEDYWEKGHKWPYDQIAKKINTAHIVDIGSGCGLMGAYLVYTGIIASADLYEDREPQVNYARDLVNYLNLQDKITVHKTRAHPSFIKNSTVISTRLGSLTQFEKFFISNRLITLRRTAEVEPYFSRPISLPWEIEIVTRDDGFQLELMAIDFIEGGMKILDIIKGERWMETVNPVISELIRDYGAEEVQGIGCDHFRLITK
jgi:hypothetical protein